MVVDDYTVRFVTKQPWPNLADSAASTNSLIMPAKALKELGPAKLAEKPIGTGRSSSWSGSGTSGWCSSAIPTTGRARPTPAA